VRLEFPKSEKPEPWLVEARYNSSGEEGRRKKFRHDPLGRDGDPASRLESSGLPGHVHVSATPRVALDGESRFTDRGVIHAKGVGEITTHFLEDRAA